MPRSKHYLEVMSWRSHLLRDIKLAMGCCVCGFRSCSSSLHFHHFKASEKYKDVGTLFRSYGLNRIKNELRVCILLCANCHNIEETRFEGARNAFHRSNYERHPDSDNAAARAWLLQEGSSQDGNGCG